MLKFAFLSKSVYRLRRLSRELWVRSALIALIALVSAVSSPFLGPLVPDGLAKALGSDPVLRILQILASSMLAVTTFSLSVMVSARQSASNQTTPRAHQLLLEDKITQNVLATFLGAFVYALASLILVSINLYQANTVVVILAFTLLVIGMVVVAIVRWIEHLTDLGSVITTTGWVEDAADNALKLHRDYPCLGARPLSDSHKEIPARAVMAKAKKIGYIQHIDIRSLDNMAAKANGQVFILSAPGSFVAETEPLAFFTGAIDPDDVAGAFTVDRIRNFDQDARFGVIVLSEIAQRALSPGINDPGTAIDIIGRLVRLLSRFNGEQVAEPRDDVAFKHVWITPLTAGALLRDAFAPIARAGANQIEVQVRLQKALTMLSNSPDPEMAAAAPVEAARALKFALSGLELEEDRVRIKELATLPLHSAASA